MDYPPFRRKVVAAIRQAAANYVACMPALHNTVNYFVVNARRQTRRGCGNCRNASHC